MGVTSAPLLSSESEHVTIVETGLMSAPAKPAAVVDILKDLILYMMDQFFFTMTYCTELALSGRTPFELVQPLLGNHIENIRKIRGSDRAKVYQARVEQLGPYAAKLQNLKGASLVETTQVVLSKPHAE